MTLSRKPTHSDSDEKPQKKKLLTTIPGAIGSGLAEIVFFQLFDNIANRLMDHRGSTRGQFLEIAFQGAHKQGLAEMFKSAYKGASASLFYKLFQRSYRFGLQPIIAQWVNENFGNVFAQQFGENNRHFFCAIFSGLVIGLGEVGLLPLDKYKKVLQIRKGEVTAGLNSKKDKLSAICADFISMMKKSPYAGAGYAAARNSIGSPVLFALKAFILSHFFGVHDPKHANAWQNGIASTAAGVASVVAVAPFDTLKTRRQVIGNRTLILPKPEVVATKVVTVQTSTSLFPQATNKTIRDIFPFKRKSLMPQMSFPISSTTKGEGITFGSIIKNEGVRALWKGSFVKSLMNGPRVGFAMFAATEIEKKIDSGTKRLASHLQTRGLFTQISAAKPRKTEPLNESEISHSYFNLNPFTTA